jgi:histone demethylase JARID1
MTSNNSTTFCRPFHPLDYFVDLLEKARDIPVQLPSVATLERTLDSAHQWSSEAQALQDSDKHPHYDTLKMMLASGRPIPVKLGLLAQLESRFAAAKAWVDRAVRTFMKKNSNQSLLEVSDDITPLACSGSPY